MHSEITTIIISKNRACQLELLLRGLTVPATVLYARDPEFKAGYDAVIEMYPEVKFIRETNFKENLLKMTGDAGEYVMFLADDDVMIESFGEDCPEFAEFKKNPEIVCLSLRMAPYHDDAPVFKNKTWEWRGLKHSFGYPMSASSHVFRKNDILPAMARGVFRNANELEIVLRRNPPNRPLMMCFEKPKLINNPVNRTQSKHPRNLKIFADDFEKRFLKGERLSLQDMREKAVGAKNCFLMTEYVWETGDCHDITIIYYTANKISDYFFNNTKKQLLKSAGNISIISVSQKPIELGENICVGDIGQSPINIYRQALIGAKTAKTKYIAMAEDDVLYSPEHFTKRPPSGVFGYSSSNQSIYSWDTQPIFSQKGRISLSSLICERKLFIEAMEEREAKYTKDEDKPLHFWGEPGKYEKQLGVTVRKAEFFSTKIPNVIFSHTEALGFQYQGTRKAHGIHRREEIPYWGKAKDVMNNFYKRTFKPEGMNAYDYIMEKYAVLEASPSPTILSISRDSDFPKLLKELGVKKGVELGVLKGKYSEILKNNLPDLDLTGVDIWKLYGEYADYEANDIENNIYNQAVARSLKCNFKIIRDWSVEASKQFEDGSLDFIYIDANHDFAHITEDLNTWSPKVKKGGIISGHDFFPSDESRYGVFYAVPAWCAYVKAKRLFVMKNDRYPSWFYVKP